jgi:hypothetical protein
MISQNLKIIFIYTLLASSRVISMDSGIMPPDDSSTVPPRNSTIASATDDPFGKLMRTLKFLSVSKGNIEPWKNAIFAYQQSLSDNAKISTLVSIRERILGEPLAKRRMVMVNRAFISLTEHSTAPVAFAPMQIIVFQTPATRERPVLISETRKHVTAKPPILSSAMKGRDSLVGQKAISASAIKAHMMSFIAGQDDSLEALSFLAHRFLCNKLLVDRDSMPASNPSHCILTGPTGCGKSESLKQLGLFLSVPILNINARSLTDEGFKGQNFSFL